MSALGEAGLRPFNDSGYEILDDDLLTTGEVVLWSVTPHPPRPGEIYTIVRDGDVHDLEVDQVVTLKRGWSARCRRAASPAD